MAKNHKQFFALREIRIISTTGHSAIIPANTPTQLHRDLWPEAFKRGAIEFDADLINAAAKAIENLPTDAAPKVTFKSQLRDAVSIVLEKKHPNDLNKQGVPKAAAVRRELVAGGFSGKDFKKLTTDAIYAIFLELMPDPNPGEAEDEEDLEDEDGISEPVGAGVAGLLGDESEADSEE